METACCAFCHRKVPGSPQEHKKTLQGPNTSSNEVPAGDISLCVQALQILLLGVKHKI